MSTADTSSHLPNGTWKELFSSRYRAAAIVLASGVGMYAINVYVTGSMMPLVVREIGGREVYGWVTTAFLIAAVVATTFGPHVINAFGVPRAYLFAFCVFATGATACALAPSMEMLLCARFLQGSGGGLLSSFGFVVIRLVFPDRLWTKAAGLMSGMWGVGNLLGPIIGGIFAQLGLWRIAFASLGLIAVTLGVTALRVFPPSITMVKHRRRVPALSLGALTLAVASFGASAVLPVGGGTAVGIAGGVLMLTLFVILERTLPVTVLPHITYRRGNPLKWVYLTLGFAAGCAIVEAFVPYFGQALGGIEPLYAGFLGGAISLGWSSAQVLSASIQRRPMLVIPVGPMLIVFGMLGFALTLTEGATTAQVWIWAAMLYIGGSGIGLAFPHLSVAAMRSTRDPIEGAKAAAGVSTAQLTSSAMASAWVGSLVTLGGPTALGSAHAMTAGVVTMGSIALVCSLLVVTTRSLWK